ncbi:histidine biosynthesis bifunctional protein HisB [Thermaurantimonas aggregans]|uniref:Histidine biosynthesis bifunctional protein HisB n=1 Tax=Thermaurantimonas aggregans TaxID=2173829 RepID=A0A401XJS9_9FLAO|nr:bifunctional histidinol-phosphatase/imidazoleglycerol-phosphate dehydratase HisB [Thermaurantimonas aggregans]MCX8149261.1 bifunctional histidinol-phosphatase/imidazoleglycerol-phosphate dehydratase HisB [Thermaurantimonas aggregans]GCD77244.1 histidine biosynthesis bifunctional protein HisB [Thermaurantimonas aggregans]
MTTPHSITPLTSHTKKKLLFIDRDGTLIHEPPETYQVDSIDKLSFLPGVFEYLGKIARQLDYDLVMVTNQDGLGTPGYPEEVFWPIQELILRLLAGEGIAFREVCIDRSFAHEGKPTRKPGTGMLTHYMQGDYDLANSWVIGDRAADVLLARNLGSRSIYLTSPLHALPPDVVPDHIVAHWREVYQFLFRLNRTVSHRRTTSETDVEIRLQLDGSGQSDIHTGLGFFDHMLEQLARHGSLDLYLRANGDLHIDEHHTIEDVAIAMGEAFSMALADKRGIERYGYALPMDDCQAFVTVDFGGRPWLVWEATFTREKIGDMPTEMFSHFFKSFADAARANVHIQAQGTNEHHKIEAIFKAFARAVRMAIRRDPDHLILPTTKGIL